MNVHEGKGGMTDGYEKLAKRKNKKENGGVTWRTGLRKWENFAEFWGVLENTVKLVRKKKKRKWKWRKCASGDGGGGGGGGRHKFYRNERKINEEKTR